MIHDDSDAPQDSESKRYDDFQHLIALAGYYSSRRTPEDADGAVDIICATEKCGGVLTGNSCKMYFFNEFWYLETWAPVVYRFPAGVPVELVVEACVAFLQQARQKGRPYPYTTVDQSIVGQYGLAAIDWDKS